MKRLFLSSEIEGDSILIQQDVTSDSCVFISAHDASFKDRDAWLIITKKDAAELGRYLIQLAEGGE